MKSVSTGGLEMCSTDHASSRVWMIVCSFACLCTLFTFYIIITACDIGVLHRYTMSLSVRFCSTAVNSKLVFQFSV